MRDSASIDEITCTSFYTTLEIDMDKHQKRNEIWLKGYNAFRAGAKESACPFDYVDWEAELWFEGYTWAVEEKYDGGREPQ